MANEIFHDQNPQKITGPFAIGGFFFLFAIAAFGNPLEGSSLIVGWFFLAIGIFMFSTYFLLGNRRANYLELDDEGFYYRYGFRKWAFRWDGCEEFGVYKLINREFVGFNLVGRRSIGAKFNLTMTGYEIFLPGVDYGLPASELAAKMNTRLTLPKASQKDPGSPKPLSPEARNYYHNANRKTKKSKLVLAALILSPLMALIGFAQLNRSDWDYCAKDQNHQRGIETCINMLQSGDVSEINRPYVIYNLGRQRHGDRQYEQAIAEFTSVIERMPGYAKAYRARGRVYKSMKLYDKAIADYDMAISLKDDYVGAYNSRAIAYKKKELFDEALADYGTAIRINPDYFYAHYNRGHLYRKLGRYEEAIVDYEAAIKINPDHRKAKWKRKKAIRQRDAARAKS